MSRLPLVLSITAVVIAVFGSTPLGHAVVSALPKNSVGPAQLKNGAVVNAKLGANAVTTNKVKNGTLLGEDFAPGQIPAGAVGATGPAGPSGSPGVSGVVRVEKQTALDATLSKQAFPTCPAGKRVIGGGVAVSSTDGIPHAQSDYPSADRTYWVGTATAPAGYAKTWLFKAVAICATVEP